MRTSLTVVMLAILISELSRTAAITTAQDDSVSSSNPSNSSTARIPPRSSASRLLLQQHHRMAGSEPTLRQARRTIYDDKPQYTESMKSDVHRGRVWSRRLQVPEEAPHETSSKSLPSAGDATDKSDTTIPPSQVRQSETTLSLDTFTGTAYMADAAPTVSAPSSSFPEPSASSNTASLAADRHGYPSTASTTGHARPAPSKIQESSEMQVASVQAVGIIGNLFLRDPPAKSPTKRKPPNRMRGRMMMVGKKGPSNPKPTRTPTNRPTRRPTESPTLTPTSSPTLPLTFPPNMDPWERNIKINLKDQNDKVMCISVIDENNNATTEVQWAKFRSNFARRDFCLLQPVPSNDGDLYVPKDFRSIDYSDKLTFRQVNRTGSDKSQADDWYEICNLRQSKAKGLRKVILFVDNSGSMYKSDVKASLNLFVKTARVNGFEIIEAKHSIDEDYISPCTRTRVY